MKGSNLYIIDQNVHLPTAKKNRRDKATDTADELAYLESFVAPDADYTPSALRSLVGRLNAQLKPKKFTGRSVDGGVRIWRVDLEASEAMRLRTKQVWRGVIWIFYFVGVFTGVVARLAYETWQEYKSEARND